MSQRENTAAALDADARLIVELSDELADLRAEHEQRLGRVLAKLNYRRRQIERAQKADGGGR